MDTHTTAPKTHRSRVWLLGVTWACLFAVLAAVALYGASRIQESWLRADAEQTALGYAEYIAESVPGLERLFTEAVLDEATLDGLRRVQQIGDVFRFKIFDRDGYRLIVSDHLDVAGAGGSRDDEALGADHSSALVRELALAAANHVEFKDGREKPARPDWYSEAYVPLVGPAGVLGVIEVYVDQSARQQRSAAAFAQMTLLVVILFVTGAIALGWQITHQTSARRRGDARIRYLAEHDALSGALNRASFKQRLADMVAAAGAAGQRFAVHCIDLDRFKDINDTLGHAAGDAVLREVALRLRSVCRSNDAIARLGGDEFAILQSVAPSTEAVERCGHGIVNALAVPIEYETHRIPTGASVGAAIFDVDACDVEQLLHRADLAMYRSKNAGRGRFSFYDAALDRAREDRRVLALDLRNALAQGALSLHYQPLFDSEDATAPSGFEALMRWQHPTRGTISPGVFIPLAEEIGEIETLGTWAIGRACADAVAWPSDRRVAVNLSPAQFREGAADVVGVVESALACTGLAPERLELEITESLLIQDSDGVLDSLQRLSALGVRIAMDDFGTGYSSLSYLWRFPFDKVKIDRAFTMSIDEDGRVEVIVASIISLAHALGIRVNAEGVETERQCETLRRLGCDELQGFLLGRPGPIPDDDDQARAA